MRNGVGDDGGAGAHVRRKKLPAYSRSATRVAAGAAAGGGGSFVGLSELDALIAAVRSSSGYCYRMPSIIAS